MNKLMEKLNTQRRRYSLFSIFLSVYFLMSLCDIFNVLGTGTILKIYGLGLMVVALFYLKRATIVLDGLFVLECSYLFICLCSVIYSIEFSASLSAFVSILLNFGLLMLCQSIDFTKDEVKFLKKSLIIGNLFVLLAALFFADYSDGGRLAIEISGDSADQNYLNGYLLFLFSHVVYKALCERKKKILSLGLAFCIFAFSLATGSRGGLLTFFAVGIALVILYINKVRMRNLVLLGVGLILAFLIILSSLPPQVAERFSLSYISEHGTTHRMEIWKALINKFSKEDIISILFGKGVYTTTYYNDYLSAYAHNLFLEILIGTGVIGLIAYSLLLFYILRNCWRTKDFVVLATLIGFIVMSMSLSLIAYKPMFNCFIIISIMYRTQQKSKPEEIKC